MSNFLKKTHKIKITNGNLVYGCIDENKCSVISLVVNGHFSPLIKNTDYQSQIKRVKNNFIKNSNEIIKNLKWVETHFIFNCDITETGIIFNKKFKWKFSLLISPKIVKSLNDYQNDITILANELTQILSIRLNEENFNII